MVQPVLSLLPSAAALAVTCWLYPLDVPNVFCVLQRHASDFGASGGRAYRVAWGFLRLSGLDQQQLAQQPMKLRLQLYQYKPGKAARHTGLVQNA